MPDVKKREGSFLDKVDGELHAVPGQVDPEEIRIYVCCLL
jgi:hypothetical protein